MCLAPQLATTSARNAVFDIPELFLRVLKELSSKDLITAALVSKAWTELALDTKWRYKPVKLSSLLPQTAPEPPRETRSIVKDQGKDIFGSQVHETHKESPFLLNPLPTLPPLEDLCSQLDQMWDVMKNPTGRMAASALDTLPKRPLNAHARKIKYIIADILLPNPGLLIKRDEGYEGNGPKSGTGPACPFLEKVDLPIAQSWKWQDLGKTASVLQGPLSRQRGMLTVEIQKRLKWLYFTDEHSDILGKAIPNLRQLIMKQTPSLADGKCPHEPTCDLNSLVTLAKYVGGTLTHLTASMVIESRTAFEALTPVGQSLYALKSLTIQHLEVTGDLVDWFSGFLAILCPNLRSFEIECFLVKRGHEGWKPASTDNLKRAFFLHQEQLYSMQRQS
ncbi:hypothetical protein FRB93_007295 [Tulasnella sp. JGI-2019a]|nr:hypothetical protein FRB93_007295 [Tulasnella sp. JGI-2019a]